MKHIMRLTLVALMLITVPVSFGAIFFSVTVAPPLLPVYTQPFCPGPGYIWVPGYWAYGDYGYYWVPGVWVLAPFTGALWTPGYWGWGDGVYLWHEGFWGSQVGFYGGIDYGFGYTGFGYYGGYWNHGSFYYNTVVNHVDPAVVRTVYSRTVNTGTTMNRVSFNGGRGGTIARPTATQLAAGRARHVPPTAAQTQLRSVASTNRAQFASVNHGRPAVLATSRAGAFTARNFAPGNPSGRANTARTSTAGRPPNSAIRQRQMTSRAQVNRATIHHPTQQQARGTVARTAPRSNAQFNRTAPAPSRYSARTAPRSAAPRYQAPVQHRMPQAPARYSARGNPAPRSVTPRYQAPVQHRTAPSPSGYTARSYSAPRAVAPHNSATVQHAVQPHPNAPRPPVSGSGAQSRRERGHG